MSTKKRAKLKLISPSAVPKSSTYKNRDSSSGNRLDDLIANIENEESSRLKTTGAEYFRPKKFGFSREEIEKARNHLEKHGYVVFASVLTKDEVRAAIKLMWEWLEGLGTGIKRTDKSTWESERWPPSLPGGIIPWFGIGQSKMQWYLRSRLGTKQTFAAVWDCEPTELITSFDGICVFREEYETVNEMSLPLHFDQNPLTKPGKHCIQGYCNLLPTTANTGGGTIIPDSHTLFENFGQRYRNEIVKLEGEDHFIIPIEDPYITSCRREKKCLVPELDAGDFFLWDSRTVHCSTAASEVRCDLSARVNVEERENEARDLGGYGLSRVVSYISMVPRSKLVRDDIKRKRRLAVGLNQTTSHWVTEFIDTNEYGAYEKYVSDRFKKLKPPMPADLTSKQKEMIV